MMPPTCGHPAVKSLIGSQVATGEATEDQDLDVCARTTHAAGVGDMGRHAMDVTSSGMALDRRR